MTVWLGFCLFLFSRLFGLKEKRKARERNNNGSNYKTEEGKKRREKKTRLWAILFPYPGVSALLYTSLSLFMCRNLLFFYILHILLFFSCWISSYMSTEGGMSDSRAYSVLGCSEWRWGRLNCRLPLYVQLTSHEFLQQLVCFLCLPWA